MTKQRKSKEFYQYIQEQMALEYGIDINKGVILQKEDAWITEFFCLNKTIGWI